MKILGQTYEVTETELLNALRTLLNINPDNLEISEIIFDPYDHDDRTITIEIREREEDDDLEEDEDY